jgi:hypothetical protein
MCQFLSAIMAILRDLAIVIISMEAPGRARRPLAPHWAYNQGSGMKTLRLMEAGRLG